MIQKADQIFEQIHLRNFKYSKLIDWALGQMKNGYNTEYLLMLSSLSYETNKEEILTYFNKALKELEIEPPKLNLEINEKRISYLVNAMNKGYQSAKSTMTELSDLCIENNYDEKFLPYYYIGSSLDLYLFENPTIFKRQTNCSTVEEYLYREINKEFNKGI